ncbi:PilN domain-containing protein [Planctomycetota bacterium]
MFTIDLLNGQAIPLKSKPGSLAIIVISVAIPVAVAAGMLSFYQRNKVVMSVKKQEIAECQAEIDKLSDAVELQRALEEKKTAYGSCLSEVKSSIKRHTQWSPVLTTLMDNIPDSVVLNSLAVEHDTVKKKVPKEDNPKKMVEVDVLVRILRLSVSGGQQSDNDKAVRDFRDRISASEFLGPRLEKIGVSQKSETLDGQDVVSYEISCVLKPGF